MPLTESRVHRSFATAAACAVLIAWLYGGVGIAHSIHESLWLDELHSTWAASGELDDVSARAAQGNQLGPYFYLLWMLNQTIGDAEIVWRSPSVCAWFATIALAAWSLTTHTSGNRRPMILAGLFLIVCDRAQIFYATEARPYALLGTVSLASWLVLQQWSEAIIGEPGGRRAGGPETTERRAAGRWGRGQEDCQLYFAYIAWCLLIWLSFWLQPTAVLSIAAQFVYLIGLTTWSLFNRGHALNNANEGRPDSRYALDNPALRMLGLALIGGLFWTLTIWPARDMLRPVWERRYLWTGFAADHSLSAILDLLPLVSFLAPTCAGILFSVVAAVVHRRKAHRREVHRLAADRHNATHAKSLVKGNTSRLAVLSVLDGAVLNRQWWMWLCAWLLPCGAVYLLTANGAAPLMHRRYVFAASVPFVIWIALTWMSLRIRLVQWCVLGAMLVGLLYQQGSLDAWQRGTWPSAVRGEDWRRAVELINSRSTIGLRQVVLCASNVIEGADPVPADEAGRQYLSLPLRSIYRIETAATVVPLANDARTWADSLLEVRRELLPSTDDAAADFDAWLVVRSSATGLDRRLRASGLKGDARYDFGGVQVVSKVKLADSR